MRRVSSRTPTTTPGCDIWRLKPKAEVKPLNPEANTPMKGKTAGIVAASALALLGACATPQEHPSPSNASPHTGGLSRDNSYASEMADIAWRETDPEELKRWLDDPLRLPGPAAGLPTEPAAPVIAASRLRADLLRLIGSDLPPLSRTTHS